MAIAHIATEYVFSDFLLKEPPDTRYKGLRLELALDKIVTCIAVGLPLLLISLAFAQEVSIGNSGSPPFPVRGGQRARRGGNAALGGARLPAGQRAPLGRGKGSCLPGKQPSRRASLAAGSSRCAGLPGRPSSSLGIPWAPPFCQHLPSRSLVSAAGAFSPVGVMGSSGAGALFVSQRSSGLEQPAGMCPGAARLLPLPELGVFVFGSGISVSLSSCQGQERGCQSSAFVLQAARWGHPHDGQWESSLKLSAALLPSCSCSSSVFNSRCDSVDETMLCR